MKIQFTENVFCEKPTLRIMQELFENVEVSDEPDFLFCSPVKNYQMFQYDCPRIFVTGENIVPDFNCVDYAVGFHYMEFEDRYLRVPLYRFYEYEYGLALNKHQRTLDVHADRKFCNFVYSNGRDAMKERDEFFFKLSNYKRVDSGGRHLNNIGGPVDSKLVFQSEYKFTIAFENAVSNGYTTEKILHAFASGTVPIYYGNPRIAEDFNEDAFINCHRYSSFEEVIEKIKEIDADENQYQRMIHAPIFKDMDNQKEPLRDYKEFLYHICKQDTCSAMRRCNDCWGARLQKENEQAQRYLKSLTDPGVKGKVLRKIEKTVFPRG